MLRTIFGQIDHLEKTVSEQPKKIAQAPQFKQPVLEQSYRATLKRLQGLKSQTGVHHQISYIGQEEPSITLPPSIPGTENLDPSPSSVAHGDEELIPVGSYHSVKPESYLIKYMSERAKSYHNVITEGPEAAHSDNNSVSQEDESDSLFGEVFDMEMSCRR